MADSLKFESLEEIVFQYGLQRGNLEELYVLDIIHKIATILKENWKTVGNYLGLSSEELTTIEYANKTEYQRKVAVLDIWHCREEKAANCWKLVNILNQHNRQDLIESLCKAMQSSAEESPQSVEKSTDPTASNSGENVPKIRGSGMFNKGGSWLLSES